MTYSSLIKLVWAIFGLDFCLSTVNRDITPSELKVIKDTVKRLNADNGVNTSWRAGNSKAIIAFDNVVLELETEERNQYGFNKLLALESKLAVSYKPELGTHCPLYHEAMHYLSGGNEKARDVLDAFCLLTLTGRGDANKPILILHSPDGASGNSSLINFLDNLIGGNKCLNIELRQLQDKVLYRHAYNANVMASSEEVMNPAKSKSLKKLVAANSVSPSNAMVLLSMRYLETLPQDTDINNKTTIIKCAPVPEDKQNRDFGKNLLLEGPQVVNYLLERFNFSQKAAIEVLNAAESHLNF